MDHTRASSHSNFADSPPCVKSIARQTTYIHTHTRPIHLHIHCHSPPMQCQESFYADSRFVLRRFNQIQSIKSIKQSINHQFISQSMVQSSSCQSINSISQSTWSLINKSVNQLNTRSVSQLDTRLVSQLDRSSINQSINQSINDIHSSNVHSSNFQSSKFQHPLTRASPHYLFSHAFIRFATRIVKTMNAMLNSALEY